MDAKSHASLDLGTPIHVEDKAWTPAKVKPVNTNPMMTPGNQVMKPYKVTNEPRAAMQPLVEDNNAWTSNTAARTWSLTPVARIPVVGSSSNAGSLLKSSLCAKAVKRKAKGGLGLATALTSQIHTKLPPPTRNTAASSAVPSLTLSPSVIGITPLDTKKQKKPKTKNAPSFLPSAWSSCFDMNTVRETVNNNSNSNSWNNDPIQSLGDSTSQRLNLDDDSDIESDSAKQVKSRTSSKHKKTRHQSEGSDEETDQGSDNILKRAKISSPLSSATVQSDLMTLQNETPRDKKTKKQKTPTSEVSSTSFVSPDRTQQRSGAVKNLRPKIKGKMSRVMTNAARKPPAKAKARPIPKKQREVTPEATAEASATDITSISALDSTYGIRTGLNIIPDGESSAYSPSGVNTICSPSIRGGYGIGHDLEMSESSSAKSRSVTPPRPVQSALGVSLISTPPDLAKAVRFMRFAPNIKPDGRTVTNNIASDTATVSSIVGMESSNGNSPMNDIGTTLTTAITDETRASTDLLKRVNKICEDIDVSVSSRSCDPTAISTNLINTRSSNSTRDVNRYCDDLSSTKPTQRDPTTVHSSSAMSDINEMCHDIESVSYYNGVANSTIPASDIGDIDIPSSISKTDMSAPKSAMKSSLRSKDRTPAATPKTEWKGAVPQTPSAYSHGGMYAPPPSSVSSFRTSRITGAEVFATPGAASVKSLASDGGNYDPAQIARMGWTPLKNGPIEGPVGFPVAKFESPKDEQDWQEQADQWIESFNKYITECDDVEL
eukprot:TRINITY_DN10671_c1_g1_i1.p1 TRINITY_DN10671_c1_g1~~TRINITY_DN10671_c1_g1_i1.p1  ORF type:complete len:775 (+),score=185.75 TRINITY_DN10671_c1_g1_i1:43-2367(+)